MLERGKELPRSLGGPGTGREYSRQVMYDKLGSKERRSLRRNSHLSNE